MIAILNKNKLLIVLSILIFSLSFFNKNLQTSSDPYGTLLTSQAIIETKSIKLDKYNTKIMSWHLIEHNQHKYYYFPIGSSLSSIPFVFIANKLFSLDMNIFEDDRYLQKIITSIVAIFIFILLYKIASLYFENYFAIFFSFIFWLGSSYSSTLATALWNQGFATIYACIAIYLTLLIIKENKDKLWFYLAIFLFFAYITRPTMSLLSVSVVLIIFFSGKKSLSIKVMFSVFFFLSLFVLFSLYEYNQFLPPYYLPKRLDSDIFWTAMYGNLFSPARGIFIYTPFLFLFLINIDRFIFVLNQNKVLYIFVAWILIHLITISKFPQWWGGGSYGPRFMIDVLIPIFVLFILLLKDILKIKDFRYKFNVGFLTVSVLLAIWINTYQGLYNKYTIQWFLNPNIDTHPEYLFDWKYPQFLHNKSRHKQRLEEYKNKQS